MSESPLLQVRNIETFYGPVMAVRGISLDVHEGQIVSILGGNGAGKTTILKTICGALEPQKGTVVFSGQDITAWQPDKTAQQGMGHVPEGREVFPFLTVKENLHSIKHIQIADNPFRHEPGTGEINYNFLLPYLDEIGYEGWVGCEYCPSGDTVDTLGWASEWL